jgi:hypothetical protein
LKPLSAGLDGVANFDDGERRWKAAEAIAEGRPDVDEEALFLLAVFSVQARRVGKIPAGGRIELFLTSVGLSPGEIRRLRGSLARFVTSPATPEEEIVHDARRLEEIGAYGLVRITADASKHRVSLTELAQEIERETLDDCRTARGRELSAPRLALMREFARRLRDEIDAFA